MMVFVKVPKPMSEIISFYLFKPYSSENLLGWLTKMHRVHQAHSRGSEKVRVVGICSRVRLVGESIGGATRLQTSRSRAARGER